MPAFLGRCPGCRTPARVSATLVRVERSGVDMFGEPLDVHVYAAPWGEVQLYAGELQARCLCGSRVSFRALKGTRTGQKCTASCRNAVSDECECSCAGENHGSNHQ
jgi:hypothetical protein